LFPRLAPPKGNSPIVQFCRAPGCPYHALSRNVAEAVRPFRDSYKTLLLLVLTTNLSSWPKMPQNSRVRLYLRQSVITGMTTTRAEEAVRQSDRIAFRMPVEASWLGPGGVVLKRMAQTLLVSRNGGVVRLQEKLLENQEITLKRQLEGDQVKSARARVVAEIDQEPEGFLYAIHLLESRSDFWDIEFPHPIKAEEALARLLMECSFCQRREVVYLNELELKSFEIRKAIARICKICDAPAIWTEVQSELTPEAILGVRQSLEERVVPRRNRTRIKA